MDSEDVLAPPLAKGRCPRNEDGGVFLPFSKLMLECSSGGLTLPADQFEQRENKELKMVDAEDVLAPPLAKGRCRTKRDGGVFFPFSKLMLECSSGGCPAINFTLEFDIGLFF